LIQPKTIIGLYHQTVAVPVSCTLDAYRFCQTKRSAYIPSTVCPLQRPSNRSPQAASGRNRKRRASATILSTKFKSGGRPPRARSAPQLHDRLLGRQQGWWVWVGWVVGWVNGRAGNTYMGKTAAGALRNTQIQLTRRV
jgi:hypothetical protein